MVEALLFRLRADSVGLTFGPDKVRFRCRRRMYPGTRTHWCQGRPGTRNIKARRERTVCASPALNQHIGECAV